MTLDQIKTALAKLPLHDLQKIRDHLEDLLESQLEPSDQCKAAITRAQQEISQGLISRTRAP